MEVVGDRDGENVGATVGDSVVVDVVVKFAIPLFVLSALASRHVSHDWSVSPRIPLQHLHL